MLVFLKYGMAGEIQGFDTGLRWFPGGAEPGASQLLPDQYPEDREMCPAGPIC